MRAARSDGPLAVGPGPEEDGEPRAVDVAEAVFPQGLKHAAMNGLPGEAHQGTDHRRSVLGGRYLISKRT